VNDNERAVSSRRAPSTADVSLTDKARDSLSLLLSTRRRLAATQDFTGLFDDIEAYDQYLRRYANRELRDARVLEIGYGARPYRLMTLLSMGVNAEGIDAEVPILRGSPHEFAAIYRVNGAERLLKSSVRYALFDRRERRQLRETLRARGLEPKLDVARFHIGDATTFRPGGPYHLIFSEDVFEHIPVESLQQLTARMAGWLAPGGVALIRPNVFTGITGGHSLDWSRQSFEIGTDRRAEPWDHLRQNRHRANTFLNGLTLAQYRAIFSTSFAILEEDVALPGLGKEFLAGEVADELSDWPEEELFSNQVRFVLRPHA
jgi:hypothetical protein